MDRVCRLLAGAGRSGRASRHAPRTVVHMDCRGCAKLLMPRANPARYSRQRPARSVRDVAPVSHSSGGAMARGDSRVPNWRVDSPWGRSSFPVKASSPNVGRTRSRRVLRGGLTMATTGSCGVPAGCEMCEATGRPLFAVPDVRRPTERAPRAVCRFCFIRLVGIVPRQRLRLDADPGRRGVRQGGAVGDSSTA